MGLVVCQVAGCSGVFDTVCAGCPALPSNAAFSAENSCEFQCNMYYHRVDDECVMSGCHPDNACTDTQQELSACTQDAGPECFIKCSAYLENDSGKVAVSYSGVVTVFEMPCYAEQVEVKLWGAGGGSCRGSTVGGGGAFVHGTLDVDWTSSCADFPSGGGFHVIVGQAGGSNSHRYAAFGGGGSTLPDGCGGGGGMSAIYHCTGDEVNRLVIAGGGGGGGDNYPGGAGGIATGLAANGPSGSGGSQSSGGSGADGSEDGSFLQGGNISFAQTGSGGGGYVRSMMFFFVSGHKLWCRHGSRVVGHVRVPCLALSICCVALLCSMVVAQLAIVGVRAVVAVVHPTWAD